jgi:anti-sigma factor RsiW
MSLESVVDEGNTNVVSSRKPETNPRVRSAHASFQTMQDRHAALVAMISSKKADKQEKREALKAKGMS